MRSGVFCSRRMPEGLVGRYGWLATLLPLRYSSTLRLLALKLPSPAWHKSTAFPPSQTRTRTLAPRSCRLHGRARRHPKADASAPKRRRFRHRARRRSIALTAKRRTARPSTRPGLIWKT